MGCLCFLNATIVHLLRQKTKITLSLSLVTQEVWRYFSKLVGIWFAKEKAWTSVRFLVIGDLGWYPVMLDFLDLIEEEEHGTHTG